MFNTPRKLIVSILSYTFLREDQSPKDRGNTVGSLPAFRLFFPTHEDLVHNNKASQAITGHPIRSTYMDRSSTSLCS